MAKYPTIAVSHAHMVRIRCLAPRFARNAAQHPAIRNAEVPMYLVQPCWLHALQVWGVTFFLVRYRVDLFAECNHGFSNQD
jgi:hypothetical protein